MKRLGRNGEAGKIPGPNTSVHKTHIVRGTGKSQTTSPSHSHKTGGAVINPRGARHPLDNRGKDTDRIKYSGARGSHRSWPR